MRQKLKSIGIQGRMLLALVLFLLYVFALWGGLYFYLNRNLQRRVSSSVGGLVSERCTAIENFMDGQFQVLQSAAGYLTWDDQHGWLEETDILELLDLMMADGSSLLRLMVADSSGQAIYSDGSRGNVADRDYFQRCMEGEQVISDPLISRVDGSETMILAVPVFGAEGEVIAMLGGSLSLDSVTTMLETQAAQEETGYSMLLNPEGQVLALSGEAGLGEWQTVNLFEEFAQATILDNSPEEIQADLSAGRTGTFRILDKSTGQWYYGAYSTVASIQARYLFYLVQEEAAGEPYSFVRISQAIMLGLLLLGSFLLLAYCMWVMSRQHQRLAEKARQDSLTGLLNHASMSREIMRLLREESGIHLLMILDLDYFKEINDTYGHQAGDQVLVAVAARLRSIFRSTDLMGRIGGDEFMIFMRSIGEESMGLERAKVLCQAIHEIELPEWPQLKVGCSIGAAFAPKDATVYQELYRQADLALYAAKHKGRNQVMAARRETSGQEEGTVV